MVYKKDTGARDGGACTGMPNCMGLQAFILWFGLTQAQKGYRIFIFNLVGLNGRMVHPAASMQAAAVQASKVGAAVAATRLPQAPLQLSVHARERTWPVLNGGSARREPWASRPLNSYPTHPACPPRTGGSSRSLTGPVMQRGLLVLLLLVAAGQARAQGDEQKHLWLRGGEPGMDKVGIASTGCDRECVGGIHRGNWGCLCK